MHGREMVRLSLGLKSVFQADGLNAVINRHGENQLYGGLQFNSVVEGHLRGQLLGKAITWEGNY